MRTDNAPDPLDKRASHLVMGEIRAAENPVQLPIIENSLMEQVLDRNNLVRALHQVKRKRQRISTYNLECNRFKLTPSNSMYGVQNDQPKTPRQLAADYDPVAAI